MLSTTDLGRLNEASLEVRVFFTKGGKLSRAWDSPTKRRWTHRLIPMPINSLVNRRHVELSFHLTILSCLACFRESLQDFGHVSSLECWVYAGFEEATEYVLFVCPWYRTVRDHILATYGWDTTSNNLVQRGLVRLA